MLVFPLAPEEKEEEDAVAVLDKPSSLPAIAMQELYHTTDMPPIVCGCL